MMKNFATTLFCSVAPAALLAQTVDLQSPDQFIDLTGEIVGFNGVMLQVETTVGTVSVPASEVICYGPGCDEAIANADLGLTAADMVAVVAQRLAVVQSAQNATEEAAAAEAEAEVAVVEETEAASPVVTPAAPIEADDALSVGFEATSFAAMYRSIAGAYATSGQTDVSVSVSADGQLNITELGGAQTAAIAIADAPDTADIVIGAVSLNGDSPAVYAEPVGWASALRPTHQMLGMSSFSVVVAPDAGVDALSLDEIAAIFAGEITNWSEVGGSNVNVLPLQLPANSGAGQEFVRLVMDPAGLEIAGNVLTLGDENGVMASIPQFPGSIGVVSTDLASDDLVIDVAGSCGIELAPTPFNIASGDYPLIRPVMASYRTIPAGTLVFDLFDFAKSDAVESSLAQDGMFIEGPFVQDGEIKNARISGLLQAALDDVQRDAAAQMFQALFDADRLSPVLTGGPASGPEGAWNAKMLRDLQAIMADPDNAGREIIFVGFGESGAGSQAAVDLSRAAAAEMAAMVQAVAAEEINAAGLTLSSFGFGNVSPASCIDGQIPGGDYSRVEVWIR